MKTAKLRNIAIYILAPVVIIFWPIFTAADEWTVEDTLLEGIYIVSNVIDIGTTLNIEDHDGYRELNPIMGSHPSRERIYATMGIGGLIHPVVTYLLPESYVIAGYDLKPRRNWQAVTIGASTGCVKNNFEIGLKLNF